MNKLTWLLATASLGVVMVAGCGDDSSGLECGTNTTEVNGVCVADTGTETTCGTGTVAMGTECVPDGSVICATGTMLDVASGTCVADITGCGVGTVVVDGECKDPADVVADVPEAAEPNDLGVDGTPGMFDLPLAGESITISGCIEPTTDANGDAVADDDAYIFQSTGPTLLEITVDGFNGAAGAFSLQSFDPELAADYLRFGVNLANDMSQRQVFLPKAAGFGLTFGDSRSLWFGEPAGGPGACYLATIRNVMLPAPTTITPDIALDGTYGTDTQFLRFTPAADGSVATSTTTAPGPATLVDTVLMVNGVYRNANVLRAFGAPANNVAAGLNVADMVTYVIDPVINLPLNPTNFSHIVSEVGSTPIPTDGTTIAVPAPGDPNDLTLDSYLSFTVANDGDVVFLDLNVSALSGDIDWTILDDSLNFVATIAAASGGEETGHYRFAQAGTYFIDIRDATGSVVDPFDVTATQIDHTPTAVVVDTPFLGQAFTGADKAAFYIATPGAFEWWNTTGTPTSFNGVMELDTYPSNAQGQLGQDVPEVSTSTLAGEDNIQLFADAPPILLKVSDSGTDPAPTAVYDFSVATNPFTDLGFVELATPANEVVTGAGANTYYIAQGNDGDVFNITITGNNGFDPQLVLVSAAGETVIDANTGADTTEANLTAVVDGRTPFIVRDAAGVGGDFTIDATFVQTLNFTSSPNVAIPDNNVVGIIDTITATACSVALVTVDVNVTHTWIGDINMTLSSPLGTPAVLHGATGGDADDILGNYPATLPPEDDLGVFVGEEGAGDWSLELTDGVGGDTGTLVSWGLNLVCI